MHRFFALLTLIALNGCATNFESKPLSAGHPANVQAQEAPRSGTKRLITTDELTRQTNAQLARKDVPNPDFQSSGMSHDMSGMGGTQHDMSKMEGMDHSKMPGMDMNKPPAGVPSPQPKAMEGMDHSKMKGMTAPAAAASPANKEAVEMEMKKTSDEMKKLSDELKARSDEAKRTKKAGGNSASTETSPAATIYTCVMHPEVQQSTPGKCPKCGMTLVKKEGSLP